MLRDGEYMPHLLSRDGPYDPPPPPPPPPPYTHLTRGTYGVLDCFLYCAQSKEFPCGGGGVPLFYCCKYPTLCARTRTVLCKVYTEDLLLFPSIVPFVVGLKLF